MSAVWGLIEARRPAVEGVAADTRIAGLSLIARHARMAARQGWAGAVVRVADARAQSQLAGALAAQPPPPGFVIEYALGADEPPSGRTYVPVDLHAIYTADALARAAASGAAPEPQVVVSGAADLRAADSALFALIRKNIDQDGVVAYYAQRPISQRLTRLLIDTPVTPNQVTLVAMGAGITAALAATFGTAAALVLAGCLYWLGAVIDCVDGELARLRLQGSKLGEWLDTLTDDISTFGLLAGLGAGIMRTDPAGPWGPMAMGAAAVGMLVQLKLYRDLHRMGSVIDTAQYPWFFGTPFDGDQSETSRGWLARAFYWVSFLFRRDAYVTATSVLLVCNLPRAAVALLGGGVVVILVLFIIHHIVMATRSMNRRDPS